MVAWPCKLAGKRMLADDSNGQRWKLPFGPVVDISMPAGGRPSPRRSLQGDGSPLDSFDKMISSLAEVSSTNPTASVGDVWTQQISGGQFLQQVFVTAGCPNSDCANQGPDGPTGDGKRGLPFPPTSRL